MLRLSCIELHHCYAEVYPKSIDIQTDNFVQRRLFFDQIRQISSDLFRSFQPPSCFLGDLLHVNNIYCHLHVPIPLCRSVIFAVNLKFGFHALDGDAFTFILKTFIHFRRIKTTSLSFKENGNCKTLILHNRNVNLHNRNVNLWMEIATNL